MEMCIFATHLTTIFISELGQSTKNDYSMDFVIFFYNFDEIHFKVVKIIQWKDFEQEIAS